MESSFQHFEEPGSLSDFTDLQLGIGLPQYGEKSKEDRIACMNAVLERFPEAKDCLSYTDLLKFCRGQKYEIDEVVKNMVFHLAWRKRVDMENPDTKHYEMSKKLGSGNTYVAGYSKKGNLIIVMKPKFSQRHQSNPDEYVMYEPQDFEQCHAHGYRAFQIPSRYLFGDVMNYIILDCKGYWITDFSRKQTKIETESFMKNFPEMMEKVFIINAPFGMQSIFKIVKLFLEPLTREKIVFVNKADDLLQYIDADVLEKQYGGNHDPYSAQSLSPDISIAAAVEDLRLRETSDFLTERLTHLDVSKIQNQVYPTVAELKECQI